MASRFGFLVLIVTCLLAGVSPGQAGSDLNEVGAFLVFPAIVALDGDLTAWETFVTVTNVSAMPVVAHVSYVNGDSDADDYCNECDFDLQLTGNDTETLVVRPDSYGIVIDSEDRTVSYSCPHPYGMMLVSLESTDGAVITDNVLLGSEVVVNYTNGYAYSIPAIPFQGKNANDGDRVFAFDDMEYGKLPRIVAADFIAPDVADGPVSASLVLFTPGFDSRLPPVVDCTVTGYDAAEHAFSRSIRFGCWTLANLCDIHPEFCYPNLSATPCHPFVTDPDFEAEDECDTHGWVKLSCRVDQDDNQSWDAVGGVHGALIQVASSGAVIRRNGPNGPAVVGAAAWARLLYQSVTAGSAVTLHLADLDSGLD